MSRVAQNLNKRRLVAGRRLRSAERAGKAVPAGEELYRSIVAALSEGILMENASGEIIECNVAAERILGLSRDQILGLTGLDPRWQMTDCNGVPAVDDTIPSRITTRTGEPQRDVIMNVRRADDSRARRAITGC